MPLSDPEARREYHRVYMQRRYHTDEEFREKHKARQEPSRKQRKQEIQAFIRSIKSESECKVCGENDPATLDFHHSDPRTKILEIGNATRYSLRVIKAEIEKCEVLCSNCHRKSHRST